MPVEPAKLSYDAIRTYAERVGAQHGIYGDDGRADVDALVRALGGTVKSANSPESMFVRSSGDFDIFLPDFTSARRDRFTKAHELAHYFLHYRLPEKQGPASFERGGSSLPETQANVFAASLLMPESLFIGAFHDLGGDIWALARKFDVSPAAAEVRARVLGLM